MCDVAHDPYPVPLSQNDALLGPPLSVTWIFDSPLVQMCLVMEVEKGRLQLYEEFECCVSMQRRSRAVAICSLTAKSVF